MAPYSTLITLAVSCAILTGPAAATSDKGTCPPPWGPVLTIPERAIPAAPTTDVHYVGTVAMVVSLSNTGYLCDIKLLKGISEVLDKQAVDAIRQQLFQPIRRDGKAVPGYMTVQRDFWRGDKSDFLISQNADASPDDFSRDARSFRAADIQALIASGKVEGETYRNGYFDISFDASGAAFTAPSFLDEQGRNVRLVEAVSNGPKREDMYAILILADRLSNYPTLKSRSEYVVGIRNQLEQEGAKRSRQDLFPYIISDVEFTGAMLREPDGLQSDHFRGIFTTVMKGYVLSLDIAATSEAQVLKIASSIKFKTTH
jgi:hypothetical protein